ncbi:hypothetical protein KIH07_03010 [Hydrogenophaga taeniospiralis]|uniref:hypothetical protein n=1 Tax=Hydrogenophaga taeniospiralis TaxID=65656 RepID=UPI001CF9F281|nr:hypothetical protein [Hydrogenophaga taeniospiralis]MCB4362686.1 hypothetical protein [Hydrogenophaga taeniospiralis]
MKRTIITIALTALAAIGLSACQTNPAKPEPTAAAPAGKKTLVEMEYELRKLEIEGQNAREERSQKALIKFGAEADNDFAKGVVAGLLGGGQKQASAPEPSRRSLLDSVTQAESIELRKLELQDKNSWWNRGLQVFDRALGYRQYSKGLSLQRFGMQLNADQDRYRLDAIRGAQQDAYEFSSGAFESGSTATLNGVAAGRTPSTETTTPAAE